MAFEITPPANPALLDLAIIEINANIKVSLPWLTHSFGKSERRVRGGANGRDIFYPAVFTGVGIEYHDLSPNENKGNFSYWEVADPYQLQSIPHQSHIITANISIVFWFNLNNVLEPVDAGNLEKVKQQILDAFVESGHRYARITINEISEQFQNVFKGYSFKQAKEQYMQRPFAALKFTGTLRYEKLC